MRSPEAGVELLALLALLLQSARRVTWGSIVFAAKSATLEASTGAGWLAKYLIELAFLFAFLRVFCGVSA